MPPLTSVGPTRPCLISYTMYTYPAKRCQHMFAHLEGSTYAWTSL